VRSELEALPGLLGGHLRVEIGEHKRGKQLQRRADADQTGPDRLASRPVFGRHVTVEGHHPDHPSLISRKYLLDRPQHDHRDQPRIPVLDVFDWAGDRVDLVPGLHVLETLLNRYHGLRR
jgi:hypothetical protein